MTDKNQRFGQIIDKKATLKKIVETNIVLGNLPDMGHIDPTGFLISPSDRIYRILSREKDYDSQAVVFFLRDYSGSMIGKPTRLVAYTVLNHITHGQDKWCVLAMDGTMANYQKLYTCAVN